MNGPHDMGGMTCYGPVENEDNEPVFHHDWEKRVFALSVTMGGMFGPIDARRYMLEILDPVQYMESSYYEKWWARFEKAALEAGLVSEEEIASGVAGAAPEGAPPAIDTDTLVRILLVEGRPVDRDEGRLEPRFAVGDRVRARRDQPDGHTRLPRYARGCVGTIDRCHGTHVFPDTNAHGEGENPQPVYSVRFTATELWGDSAPPNDSLYIDLWEDHLDAVE